MNSKSKAIPFAVVALAATLSVFTPVPSRAQDDPFSGGEVAPPPTFDLEFSGGPIGDFLDVLRKGSGDAVNIVIPDSSRNVAIPPMSLRGVNNDDVKAVLNELGGFDPEHKYHLEPATENIWVFHSEGVARRPENQEVMFLPVSRHLESHSIEDIHTTIATAWEMLDLPDDPRSHIRFHEDTKLLIASGTEEMLGIAEGALAALAAEGNSKHEQTLVKQLAEGKRKFENLEARAVLDAQLSQEKSTILRAELSRNLDQLRAENTALRTKIRGLESELATPKQKH